MHWLDSRGTKNGAAAKCTAICIYMVYRVTIESQLPSAALVVSQTDRITENSTTVQGYLPVFIQSEVTAFQFQHFCYLHFCMQVLHYSNKTLNDDYRILTSHLLLIVIFFSICFQYIQYDIEKCILSL